MSQCDLKKQSCMNAQWQLCLWVGILGNAQEILKQTSKVPICLDSDLTSV